MPASPSQLIARAAVCCAEMGTNWSGIYRSACFDVSKILADLAQSDSPVDLTLPELRETLAAGCEERGKDKFYPTYRLACFDLARAIRQLPI